MTDAREEPGFVARMRRAHGSRFAACPCGRPDVLLYKRDGSGGLSNGPDADRYTYHDTPTGIACAHGGELLSSTNS